MSYLKIVTVPRYKNGTDQRIGQHIHYTALNSVEASEHQQRKNLIAIPDLETDKIMDHVTKSIKRFCGNGKEVLRSGKTLVIETPSNVSENQIVSETEKYFELGFPPMFCF